MVIKRVSGKKYFSQTCPNAVFSAPGNSPTYVNTNRCPALVVAMYSLRVLSWISASRSSSDSRIINTLCILLEIRLKQFRLSRFALFRFVVIQPFCQFERWFFEGMWKSRCTSL